MNCKYTLAFLLTILLFVGEIHAQSKPSSAKIFGVEELKEDFAFLRHRLEHKHPLLYLYRTKAEIDKRFDSIDLVIKHPMTELAFHQLIVPLTAFIKDGHNNILPSKKAMDSITNSSQLLPFDVTIIKEKLYVIRSQSSSKDLQKGVEITAIDKVSIEEILSKFLSILPRDGENLQLPYSFMSNYFRFYYHLNYGLHPKYAIDFVSHRGTKGQCVIEGSKLDSIRAINKRKYPKPIERLDLKVIDSLHTALLTLPSFDAHSIKKSYQQNFKKEIAHYFELIEASNISHLILDLRDNSGGNPNYVKYVLKHLFDKPFEQTREARVVKHPEKEAFLERTQKKWYPWYGIGTFKPVKNSFKGEIYVLVNEGTFSAAVELASALQKYDRATFIGRETGGNPIVMAGYWIKTIWELPNTEIQISPGRLCTIHNDLKENKGRGLIPEHLIEANLEDLFSSEDRIMEYVHDLIQNKKTLSDF